MHTCLSVLLDLKCIPICSQTSTFLSSGCHTFSSSFSFHFCWNSSSFILMPKKKKINSNFCWTIYVVYHRHFVQFSPMFHKHSCSLYELWGQVLLISSSLSPIRISSDDSLRIWHSLLGWFCGFLTRHVQLHETIFCGDRVIDANINPQPLALFSPLHAWRMGTSPTSAWLGPVSTWNSSTIPPFTGEQAPLKIMSCDDPLGPQGILPDFTSHHRSLIS